jgi:hypothetical protein
VPVRFVTCQAPVPVAEAYWTLAPLRSTGDDVGLKISM